MKTLRLLFIQPFLLWLLPLLPTLIHLPSSPNPPPPPRGTPPPPPSPLPLPPHSLARLPPCWANSWFRSETSSGEIEGFVTIGAGSVAYAIVFIINCITRLARPSSQKYIWFTGWAADEGVGAGAGTGAGAQGEGSFAPDPNCSFLPFLSVQQEYSISGL